MRDIYDFNHIDQTLPKEKVKKMKDLYACYHKKHFGCERLYRGFRRKILFVIFRLANLLSAPQYPEALR